VKDFNNFLCNFRKTIVTRNGRGSLESMLKRDEGEANGMMRRNWTRRGER